jgi:NAD(P)-dependent dehydrogenase (short-subunit alcohol dehydrogenase family)
LRWSFLTIEEEQTVNIKDRVAIVTGSGSGIGKGIITLLAEKGAKVVVVDSNGDAASQAAQ